MIHITFDPSVFIYSGGFPIIRDRGNFIRRQTLKVEVLLEVEIFDVYNFSNKKISKAETREIGSQLDFALKACKKKVF